MKLIKTLNEDIEAYNAVLDIIIDKVRDLFVGSLNTATAIQYYLLLATSRNLLLQANRKST